MVNDIDIVRKISTEYQIAKTTTLEFRQYQRLSFALSISEVGDIWNEISK